MRLGVKTESNTCIFFRRHSITHTYSSNILFLYFVVLQHAPFLTYTTLFCFFRRRRRRCCTWKSDLIKDVEKNGHIFIRSVSFTNNYERERERKREREMSTWPNKWQLTIKKSSSTFHWVFSLFSKYCSIRSMIANESFWRFSVLFFLVRISMPVFLWIWWWKVWFFWGKFFNSNRRFWFFV